MRGTLTISNIHALDGVSMRKCSLGLLGLTLTSVVAIASANAADIYRAPEGVGGYKDGPAYVANTWTGFYIGANAGYGRNKSDITYNPPGLPFTGVAPAYSAIGSGGIDSQGFIGGGQAGYNYQFGRIVLGAEVDIDAFNHTGSFNKTGQPAGNVPLNSVASVETDWLATLRGRVGLAFGSVLFYGTGGAAATDLKFKQSNTYQGNGIGTESFSLDGTRWGWTAGGGIEYLITPKWSFKAEYLHADFGKVSGGTDFTTGGTTQLHSHSVSLETDIVRAGVNYHVGPSYEPLK
jgi:outer membrane immunogenic protein